MWGVRLGSFCWGEGRQAASAFGLPNGTCLTDRPTGCRHPSGGAFDRLTPLSSSNARVLRLELE